MQIEAGKYYRTRDGQKVGPMSLPRPDDVYRWNVLGLNWGRYRDDGEDGNATGGTYEAGGDLIAEWRDEPDLTAPDYNDGKWHGWNGGECPVDPASMVDVHYINAFGGYGRDENRLAGQHSWALACLFRVTKPAPPKPREGYVHPDHVYPTLEAFWDAHHPSDTPIHVREVTD